MPDASAIICTDPDMVNKIRIGKVPMFQKTIFSISPGAAEWAAFARKSGAHVTAIKAVRDGACFKEEFFARRVFFGAIGAWGGASPLHGLELT